MSSGRGSSRSAAHRSLAWLVAHMSIHKCLTVPVHSSGSIRKRYTACGGACAGLCRKDCTFCAVDAAVGLAPQAIPRLGNLFPRLGSRRAIRNLHLGRAQHRWCADRSTQKPRMSGYFVGVYCSWRSAVAAYVYGTMANDKNLLS